MAQKFIALRVGLLILICLGGAQSMGVAQSQQRTGGASLEQNKALVRRWIEEGFNKRDLKVVDESFGEDFIVNGLKVGRGKLKQSMSRHLDAFPDLHVVIDEIIAEGDKVGIWYTAQGTQRGEFQGVPPTGKHVNWVGVDFDASRAARSLRADSWMIRWGFCDNLGQRFHHLSSKSRDASASKETSSGQHTNRWTRVAAKSNDEFGTMNGE